MVAAPEPFAVYLEGSPQHPVGLACMRAARLLGLHGESAKLLDDVLIRLCDSQSEQWDDQFALAFAGSFRAGYRASGGTLFAGSIADALSWALANGLVERAELDLLVADSATAEPDLAAIARSLATTRDRTALNA